MKAACPEVSGKAPVLGVSVAEACRITGLSRSFVWLLIKNGRLRTISAGRRRIIVYKSLPDLFEDQNETALGVASTEGSKKEFGKSQ
jgi:excisionase family DNA binding protein